MLKDDVDEQWLTADIITLAKDYSRYGDRRIHALLGQAGWQVSLSVVERMRSGSRRPAAAAEQALKLAGGDVL